MNNGKLVIKQERTQLWKVCAGSLIVLALAGIFVFGRYLAIADLSETKKALKENREQLLMAENDLKTLSETLVMQQQSYQVDQQSSKQLVGNVKELQQVQNDLESELAFYRRIMSPELAKDGLKIDSFQVSKSDEKNQFHYRVSLIQAGKQTQYLKGNVKITVEGKLNGLEKRYAIEELGRFDANSFAFQFKYFQNIQGFLELPKKFVPSQVTLQATTKGRGKRQKVDKKFIWQPLENQNYVR